MDELWSVSLYDLRLSDELFWSLTYRQLDRLLERCRIDRRREEYMLAQITAAVCNHGMRTYDPALSPDLFMLTRNPGQPKPRRVSKKIRPTKSSRATVDAKLRAFFQFPAQMKEPDASIQCEDRGSEGTAS